MAEIEWPFRRPKGEPQQIVDENGQRCLMQEYTYASESEERWAKKWKRTIEEGVIRRQTHLGILTYVPDDPESLARREAEERRRRETEPSEGFAGAATSILRGINNIVQENQDGKIHPLPIVS